MGHAVDIEIENIEGLQKRFKVVLDAESRKDMMRTVGMDAQERIAEHIADASNSRHKTADGLGAEHSHYLEWAPGRGLFESTSKYKPKDGEDKPYLKAQGFDSSSVDVVIGNTPGLMRAYHDLNIKPKEGKEFLTIPKSPISYSLRVKEVRKMGWSVFRPKAKKGSGERPKVLLGSPNGAKGKDRKTELLYILCGKVTVPKDEGLLPKDDRIASWAADAAEEYIESYSEMMS